MPQSREQKERAYKRKFDILMKTNCYTKHAACMFARKNSWEQIVRMLVSDIITIRSTIDVYLSDDEVKKEKLLSLITIDDLRVVDEELNDA